MYCPKCGREEAAEEIRFCPKCGFALDRVRSLIRDERAGALTVRGDAGAASTRKKDVIAGASVMTVVALVIMLLAVSSAAPTPTLAVVIPLLILWALLVSGVLLSRHAVDEVRKLFSREPGRLYAGEQEPVTGRGGELGPGEVDPRRGLWKAATSELEPVPSVTEQTTGLLDKDRE